MHANASLAILPLNETNHIGFYLGNSVKADHNYQPEFGFGLKSLPIRISGNATLPDTYFSKEKPFGAYHLPPTHLGILQQVLQNGDGVKVLALWV